MALLLGSNDLEVEKPEAVNGNAHKRAVSSRTILNVNVV